MSIYSGSMRWAGQIVRSLGGKRQPAISWQPLWRANNRRMSDRSDLNLRRPTNFEKRVLVFTKFYPSVDAVPKEVSSIRIVKSKDLFRMKASIGLMFATVAISLVMIFFGRRAAQSGQSLYKDNIDQFQQRHKTSMSVQPEK